MFTNASHTHISGAARLIHRGDVYNTGSRGESLDEGIRLLVARVVAGAMHNSGERFDAPKCHEDTRIAVQDDLLSWADELVKDLNELVTWMYGPAGAGKSAIAQTIAQKLHDRGQLTASFFFSRASDSGGRGAETNLVATLAHQLSLTVPATQPHIAAAIRANPLVFELSLQDQVDALIVAPLTAVSSASSGSGRPRVIVVDGLDECRKEHDAQMRVVDALIFGLRRIPHQSHKLFITSRPEHNIVSIFKKYAKPLVRSMELNDKWNPSDDIRTFLNAGFADIRRSHSYFQSRAADKAWPNPRHVEKLVNKSSGQFVYASVVIKYIKSEDNYNPLTRLQSILSLKNCSYLPYAELDALYKHIFSQIQNVERVLDILYLHRHLMQFRGDPPLKTFLSILMGAHIDEIKFWLRPLVSLLVWQEDDHHPDGKIRFMHASLQDFLWNERRSNILSCNAPTIKTRFVHQAMALFEDGTASQFPHLMGPLIHIFRSDDALRLISESKFSIVENILCKIDPDFIETSGLLIALEQFLDWLLSESKARSILPPAPRLSRGGKCASKQLPAARKLARELAEKSLAKKLLARKSLRRDRQKAFDNLVAQIRTWLINQSRDLQFMNLDNTEQVDMWPFFTSFKDTRRDPDTSISRRSVAQDLSSALEICASSPSCRWPSESHGEEFSLSNQTAVLCYLMPYLKYQWLHQPGLGQCAMTKERYGWALRQTAFYILQLPRHIIVEILESSESMKELLATPVMRMISDVFIDFLARSLLAGDLYLLLALIKPLVQCLDIDPDASRIDIYMARSAYRYPFLEHSTSPDYIQAKRNLETACINWKIKTSLHEVAGRMGLTPNRLTQYQVLLDSFAIIDRRVHESV